MGGNEVACFLLEGRGEWEDLKARLLRSFPDLLFQLVDARSGSNERFFRLITAQTLKASGDGSLLARKPEVDLLLRLARTTQISEALARVGYKRGEKRILIAAGKKWEVMRLVASGIVVGMRLRSVELSENEWLSVEEAAILSALRT
ncbi:MAG: hypothetical protein E6K86_04635 [Thaumarchaeota archaeon]|nr:MAG: hypothetical protein E6K86_04635 [Nitrososphaerota archaeon]